MVRIEGFEEVNLDYDFLEKVLSLEDGGWEIIDIDGRGDNTLTLDYETISMLSNNNELSLDINGSTETHVLKIRGNFGTNGGDSVAFEGADVTDATDEVITSLGSNEVVYEVSEGGEAPVFVIMVDTSVEPPPTPEVVI